MPATSPVDGYLQKQPIQDGQIAVDTSEKNLDCAASLLIPLSLDFAVAAIHSSVMLYRAVLNSATIDKQRICINDDIEPLEHQRARK